MYSCEEVQAAKRAVIDALFDESLKPEDKKNEEHVFIANYTSRSKKNCELRYNFPWINDRNIFNLVQQSIGRWISQFRDKKNTIIQPQDIINEFYLSIVDCIMSFSIHCENEVLVWDQIKEHIITQNTMTPEVFHCWNALNQSITKKWKGDCAKLFQTDTQKASKCFGSPVYVGAYNNKDNDVVGSIGDLDFQLPKFFWEWLDSFEERKEKKPTRTQIDFFLLYQAGQNYEQIAKVKNCSPQNAEKTIKRAINNIAVSYDKYLKKQNKLFNDEELFIVMQNVIEDKYDLWQFLRTWIDRSCIVEDLVYKLPEEDKKFIINHYLKTSIKIVSENFRAKEEYMDIVAPDDIVTVSRVKKEIFLHIKSLIANRSKKMVG